MDFYNDLITQKSWEMLGQLKKKIKFVLIGGWAVYLYTKSLKSKDIDIIVDFDQLAKLKKEFAVTKNERLKKYEARREEVQIDIYLPHYSDLGIPVEEVIKNLSRRETFSVPVAEMLLMLKLLAYNQRKISVKGEKDRIDILALLSFTDIDFSRVVQTEELKNLIKSTVKIPELGINEHQWSRKKKLVLEQL